MASKQWHLVSYDVRDPKRLRQVAKLLESYGSRLQYSVFRCRLDVEMLERLHWQLSQIMEDVDDLLVIPLCNRCAGESRSTPRATNRVGPSRYPRSKSCKATIMDRRVVEENRGNRRRNVLACIDNSLRRLSDRCLTIAPALRKCFSLKGFGDAVKAPQAVFRSATPFRATLRDDA